LRLQASKFDGFINAFVNGIYACAHRMQNSTAASGFDGG
jgi:hypothetical protein